MFEHNNEAASLNFSFRRIFIIAILPVMFAFFFNGVEVEVVSNDHADFHQYSENSVSPGTSYYDDGAVQPFASAWNSLAQNVARMLGYTHLISDNTNTTNSYIATLYTYLSNNLPGQWQTLTDIKTSTTNTAVTLSAMNTLLTTLDWQSSSAFGGLYDEVGGTALSSFTNQTKGTVYARFGPLSSASNLFKITVPIYGGSNSVRNSYISNITLKTSNMQTDIRQDQYLVFYDNFVDHTDVYLYLYAPISTYFFLKIDLAYNISYNDSYSSAGSYYLGTNSPDYVDFMNYLSNRHSMNLLKDIKDKDFTAEIDGSTIEIDNSINVTPIELDVSIGVQDFTAVNTVSNKLRTWLSTGVGVVDLIAALDQLDDTFFTLHNRSVIETISTGYTDYYD